MLAVGQKARKPAEKIASYATKISEILVMKRQDVNGAEARARELEDEFTRLDIEVSHHTDDNTNDTPSTAVSYVCQLQRLKYSQSLITQRIAAMVRYSAAMLDVVV